MNLIFSEEADQDVEAIDAWWRENRLDAPRLFAEELASVCQAIQRKPLIMKPYTECFSYSRRQCTQPAPHRRLSPRRQKHASGVLTSQRITHLSSDTKSGAIYVP